MLQKTIAERLLQRREAGTYRGLGRPPSDLADFSSNDYLGMARSGPGQLTGSSGGSTGSRLLTGNSRVAEQTEEYLAGIWNYPGFLFFPTGYMANLGVLSCLPQRENVILYDSLSHACIKDGMRLSVARHFSFRHNDLNDLENKLRKHPGKALVVVESVYSMDGDEAPLKELIDLAGCYGAGLIVDEAHATGIAGKNGGGLSEELGLQDQLLATIYTFGKGFGYHGAGVAASKEVIEFLINFSRPFIYTTAMPESFYRHIQAVAAYLCENDQPRKQLLQNIRFFHQTWSAPREKLIAGNRAIQGVLIPGNREVKEAAVQLVAAGYDVRPILSPTVPRGEERLRICLHSYNEAEEIRGLVKEIEMNL